MIVLATAAPVFAWPQTRRLTPFVLLSDFLFLGIKWDFVAGSVMPYHDTAWNLEGWSILVQQWIHSGLPLGWNPYIGAGQPMALYNNPLSSIPSVAFSGLFKALGLPFDPVQNFKLIWIFAHLNICTGSLLFFRALFRESWVCLLGFASMLFGGYFFVELGQGVAVYVLSFLPYMLFFLIGYYRERTWMPLFLFSLFLGMSMNYYIPTYMIYTLVLFLVSVLLVNGVQKNPRLKEEIRSLFTDLFRKPGRLALCLLLVVVPATPMLYNFAEMQDFMSPTRGFSTDQGRLTRDSFQTLVAVPFHGYQKLIHPRLADMTDLHSGFYIGFLPSLAVVGSLVAGGNWIFLTLSFFLILLAAPEMTGVSPWGWVRHYMPLGETIRHTFLFGRLATFFLLTASLAGLLALQKANVPFMRKILAVTVASAFWAAFSWSVLPPARQVFLVLAALCLMLLSAGRLSGRSWWPVACLGVVVAFHAGDLLEHAIHRTTPKSPFWNKYEFPRSYPLNPIAYPSRWKVRSEDNIPVPQYLKPAYTKEAIWANPFPGAMLWLQKDFAWFLINQRFLEKDVDYFYPDTYKNLRLKNAEGTLFHAVRAGGEEDPDALSLKALKRILKVDRPVLKLEEMRSGVNGESTGEGPPGVSGEHSGRNRKPALRLTFSMQPGFQPDRLEVAVQPWGLPWQGDHAELWESADRTSWRFVQKLNADTAVAGESRRRWTFPLKRALTQPYIKLVIDLEHMNHFHDVNLVESRVQEAGTESVVLSGDGVLVQKPSARADRVVLDLNLPQDAWILRLENYHKNWTATLDGREVAIRKVFPNFQAVFVKAGRHELAFQFESAYHGLVILHIAAGVLGAFVFLAWLAGLGFGNVKEGAGRKGVGASVEA